MLHSIESTDPNRWALPKATAFDLSSDTLKHWKYEILAKGIDFQNRIFPRYDDSPKPKIDLMRIDQLIFIQLWQIKFIKTFFNSYV